jgi:hypothetical protein
MGPKKKFNFFWSGVVISACAREGTKQGEGESESEKS